MVHHLENAIKYDKPRTYLNSKGIEITDVCDWLKSLRPQKHWKPSDKQIKALETTLYTNMSRNDERYLVLSEFVAELKKLREKQL